ncbi:MAG: hypothetical protein AABY58_05290 [Nitrospirota bacterium]
MPYKKGVLFEGALPEKERELVQKSLTLIPSIIKEAVIKLASAPPLLPLQGCNAKI